MFLIYFLYFFHCIYLSIFIDLISFEKIKMIWFCPTSHNIDCLYNCLYAVIWCRPTDNMPDVVGVPLQYSMLKTYRCMKLSYCSVFAEYITSPLDYYLMPYVIMPGRILSYFLQQSLMSEWNGHPREAHYFSSEMHFTLKTLLQKRKTDLEKRINRGAHKIGGIYGLKTVVYQTSQKPVKAAETLRYYTAQPQ